MFARGPLCHTKVVEVSKNFVPVFIDTLKDAKNTKRFGERFGSYPVLRIHNLDGEDIAGRIDGNPVAGQIPAGQILDQFAKGQRAFRSP